MKALKEKRVSLRSLIRRGLVILSLFALVFASCGDSGSGEGGGGGGGGGGGQIVTTAPFVQEIRVLKHPSMYSCEGAAPNLTGLEFEIRWVKGATVEYENVVIKDMDDANIKRLKVNPPIVRVTGASVSTVSTSGLADPTNGYTIEYNGGELSLAGPANLYIPAVLAMSTVAGFTADPSMSGTIPAIWEDKPIEPGSIKFGANYLVFPGGIGYTDNAGTAGAWPTVTSIPDDYGRIPAEFNWPTETNAQRRYNPVSSDPRAWYIIRNADSPTYESALNYRYGLPGATEPNYYNAPPQTAGEMAAQLVKADVKTFYYVAKMEFKGFTNKLRPFIVDEDRITSPASDSKVDWLKEFTNAGAEFTVYYYTGPNQTVPADSRVIGMGEYKTAMTTLGPLGYPMATKVSISHNYTGSNGANLITFANDDFDVWTASLFYYTPGITGTANEGVPPEDPSVTDPTSGWYNGAVINLVNEISVYTFSGDIDVKRKDNTGPIGKPQVRNSTKDTVPNIANALLNALKEYYELSYVYSLAGSTTDTIKYGAPNWPSATTVAGLITGDVIDPDGEVAPQLLELALLTPPSDQYISGPGSTADVTFEYEVMP